MVLDAGSPLPAFRLEAVESRLPVGDGALATGRAVLVFHGPRTTAAPKEVGKAVRKKWPDPDDVLVANIVDLRRMGGMWQKVAKAQMRATYDRLATRLAAEGSDPTRLVVICPDWDGATCTAFGVERPDEAAAVVLVENGRVMAATEGVAEDLAQLPLRTWS